MAHSIPTDAKEVTPSNTQNLEQPGTLYIGTGGNVKVTTIGGTTLIYYNVPDGFMLPVAVKRVWEDGTTATNINSQN